MSDADTDANADADVEGVGGDVGGEAADPMAMLGLEPVDFEKLVEEIEASSDIEMPDGLMQWKNLHDELSKEGNGHAVVGALRRFERGFLGMFGEAEAEIEAYRAGEWPSEDDVQQMLAGQSPAERRQQYEQARSSVLVDVAGVFVGYNEVMLSGRVDRFRERIVDALVSLHNPLLRESLLLAVRDEYREDVRAMFAELAAILWGWVAATTGVESRHLDLYLEYIAGHLGGDPQQYRAVLLGEMGGVGAGRNG